MQKIRLAFISTWVMIVAWISPVYGNHQDLVCLDCHDDDTTRNLSLIREVIATPNSGPKDVWFTAYEGWRSFADADPVYDGVCEVCHTTTSYHRNDGTGYPGHFEAEDCRPCHVHDNDFLPAFVQDSHDRHLVSPAGPLLQECESCHLLGDYSRFYDGEPLGTTIACDTCHSLEGAYDGVNDPVIGSKANWQDGAYNDTGDALKPGKELWCAGCHDDGPCMVNGVSAPNVMGDNVTYGYNESGHGRYPAANVKCDSCHDLTVSHVDGQARTYSAGSNNYRAGYRLNEDMDVPRDGETGPQAFRLCTNCHNYAQITGPASNFRDDIEGKQYHEIHLNDFPSHLNSDSDFDGTGCSTGTCIDSATTCIICHDVHGSRSRAMIRHGELISTPGTTDKVPALDFQWYKADGSTPTTLLGESHYGSLRCGEMPNVSVNHVCAGCHATTGRLYYYRTPRLCLCSMVPDNTLIPRGEAIGFQATVTNKTDISGYVQFATKITLPGGGDYPDYGFLDGPFWVFLTPHGSGSGHMSRPIPFDAPLGTYTYHGYVGRYDMGVFHRCEFEFQVVAP